jgi:cytochrome c biogenesis protein CcdA
MSRRAKIFLWLALVSIIIGTLVYLQQIAILYILATIALIVLLLIVAFADLDKVSRNSDF